MLSGRCTALPWWLPSVLEFQAVDRLPLCSVALAFQHLHRGLVTVSSTFAYGSFKPGARHAIHLQFMRAFLGCTIGAQCARHTPGHALGFGVFQLAQRGVGVLSFMRPSWLRFSGPGRGLRACGASRAAALSYFTWEFWNCLGPP